MLKDFDYDRFHVQKGDPKNDIRPYKVTVTKGATNGFVWELTLREYASMLENILMEKEILKNAEIEEYD